MSSHEELEQGIAHSIRTIEYYKEVLETNPKWLGVQAHELLAHYIELENRCEQWLAEAQDNNDSQIRTMTKIEHALMDAQAEFGRLEREIEDWEQSFNLYDDAMRRGTKLWQEASGYTEAPRVWPDGAKLMAWILTKLDASMDREYAEASGRTNAEGDLSFWRLQLDRARDQIWKLIYPYISEDNIAYTEENMEALCENALPKIWDTLLEVGPECKLSPEGCDPNQEEGKEPWEDRWGQEGPVDEHGIPLGRDEERGIDG